jgi:hypothetical protein
MEKRCMGEGAHGSMGEKSRCHSENHAPGVIIRNPESGRMTKPVIANWYPGEAISGSYGTQHEVKNKNVEYISCSCRSGY